METTVNRLTGLIAAVRGSSRSDFYRARWGTTERFEDLPLLGPEDLAAVPLAERRYKEEKALVKIVQSEAGPFLSEWALDDIAAEAYGASGSRPLVLLSNSHEVVEKTLWYYERNILPLAGENKNLPLAAFTAKRYGVDAVVSDEAIFSLFLAQYEKEYGTFETAALTLLGSRFSPDAAHWRARFPGARLVLARPETGAFAEACTAESGELRFHAQDSAVVELIDGRAVLTKLSLLTTPLIRYRTALAASAASCSCGRAAFSL